MATPVIVDTGPLVAALHARDRHHEWARETLGRSPRPLLTCEAVAAEASFVSSRTGGNGNAILELVSRTCSIPLRLEDEWRAVLALMRKYADVPMSLADACLVRLAERHSGSAIATLDQDFRLYRVHGRRVIKTIAPWN
jgi:predicted nucleic acid-binding protein